MAERLATNTPPTLYDEVMTCLRKTGLRRWRRWDQGVTPKRDIDVGARVLRQAMFGALRYELTDDAMIAAQIFSLEHMDAMVSGMRWLRPLASEVWIEFEVNSTQLDNLKSRFGRTLNTEPPPEKYVPSRVGYLISQLADGPEMLVRAVTVGRDSTIVNLPLICAYIFPDKKLGSRTYYNPGLKRQRSEIMQWTVGVELHKYQENDQTLPPNQLLEHFDIGVIGKSQTNSAEFLKRVSEAYANHCGLARRAAAILFLLTHRKLIAARLHESAFSSGMAQDLPYWGHSVIGIKLPREKAVGSLVRFAQRGNRPPVRRHDVEGHWCWSHKTDLGCGHAWQEENEGRRFRCACCGGLRWFKRPHERGDAGRGWVVQRRVVTAKAPAAEVHTHG